MCIKYTIVWILLGLVCFLTAPSMHSEVIEIIMMFFGTLAFFRGFKFLFKASYYYTCAEEAIDNEST